MHTELHEDKTWKWSASVLNIKPAVQLCSSHPSAVRGAGQDFYTWLVVKVCFVLDVDDELDVKKTEVTDYVQVDAKKPESVLFCWRLRAFKSQTEHCMIVSRCQAAFCPLEPSSCQLPWEYVVLFLPSVQKITTECLPSGSGVFLCPEHFYLGTCNQFLNCFLLYFSFSLHTQF